MACDATLGRLIPCKDVVGGIKNIYFINDGDAGISITYDSSETDRIDSIGTAVDAFKYELATDGNNFEQSETTSRETGTSFQTQTLSITLKKLTVADHKELKLISYGRPKVIIEDYNQNLFLAGLENGCDVTGGTTVTGSSMGELSGYTLTLEGKEKIRANFCDAGGATVAANLVALGVSVTVGT